MLTAMKEYEKPEIIYETTITTRAGSPLVAPANDPIDPMNLFKDGKDD